ncbi:hypothetical protein JQN72_00915 [Phycicoccus sp. CSK15P-2]|uniref:hypothetical protein n=1 Tax=Phycicoccus sp. CSK15P-2 TaxID=2807627 RepID=UPI00195095A7|nr:hypothetical protein [Phycicoccus sp. CSK15P-2]MBM6402806.1 hypothetical protein [Phycicoccus sp. CSK15P-2]
MTTDDTTRPLAEDLGLGDDRDDADAPTTDTVGSTAGASGASPGPTYRQGPAPFGLVLGMLGLVTAVVCGLSLTVDVSVPWEDVGPWVVVGGGLLVLGVGALGLRASRRQD